MDGGNRKIGFETKPNLEDSIEFWPNLEDAICNLAYLFFTCVFNNSGFIWNRNRKKKWKIYMIGL